MWRLAVLALFSAAPPPCGFSGGVNLLSASGEPAWTTPEGTMTVSVSFDGGAKSPAVLSRAVRDGGLEVSTGTLSSGYAARYDEYLPPEFLQRVLVVEGRSFPLVKRTTMGGGGGGGAALSVLIASDGGLTEQWLGSIEGATTLNHAVVLGPGCADVLRVKGRTVSLQSCFDGVLQAAECFEWNGKEFIRQKR